MLILGKESKSQAPHPMPSRAYPASLLVPSSALLPPHGGKSHPSTLLEISKCWDEQEPSLVFIISLELKIRLEPV